ncbi:hypothetical protein D3C77_384770 [compost metagenome]
MRDLLNTIQILSLKKHIRLLEKSIYRFRPLAALNILKSFPKLRIYVMHEVFMFTAPLLGFRNSAGKQRSFYHKGVLLFLFGI